MDLIVRQGQDAATMVIAMLRRLDIVDAEADVVQAGSLLRSENQLLLGTIVDRVGEVAPDARVVVPDVDPVVGAVLSAFDAEGIHEDQSVLQRLSEGSVKDPSFD